MVHDSIGSVEKCAADIRLGPHSEPGGDPKEYFQNSFGVILDEKCPPEFIELKVYGTKRDYFRTLPLHHSQKEIKTDEDYSIFQYYISPTYDFIQEILSHGYEVEVVSPSHLKGYIRWQAETIASR